MTGPTLAGLSPDAQDVLSTLADGALHKQRDMAFRLAGGLWGAPGGAVRRVQAATQELRLAGWPLVSDGDGMHLSDDPVVVRACADALRRRAITQWRTARALRRTSDRMAQPLVLWEVPA